MFVLIDIMQNCSFKHPLIICFHIDYKAKTIACVTIAFCNENLANISQIS